MLDINPDSDQNFFLNIYIISGSYHIRVLLQTPISLNRINARKVNVKDPNKALIVGKYVLQERCHHSFCTEGPLNHSEIGGHVRSNFCNLISLRR